MGGKGKGAGGIAEGYLFVCASSTQGECASKRLFGSPGREFPDMQRSIGPNTKLFLFNMQTYTMMGPFSPSGTPANNIVAAAFGGKFTAQLRVTPLELPLHEVKMEFRPPAGPKSAQDVQNMLMRLKSGTVHRMDWGEASGNASGVGGDSIGEVDADGAVRVPLDTEALGAMPPEARSDFEADLAALSE